MLAALVVSCKLHILRHITYRKKMSLRFDKQLVDSWVADLSFYYFAHNKLKHSLNNHLFQTVTGRQNNVSSLIANSGTGGDLITIKGEHFN